MERRKQYQRRKPELPRISFAAARGGSREDLSARGAQGLLNVGRGERAGIWLAPPVGQTDDWKGRVENRNRDATPPEWSRLDPSLSFLRPSFESGTALSQSLDGRGGLEMFWPLLCMPQAVWNPLRVGAGTFRVA